MFKTFKIGGGDESGRPVDPSGAMKKHARWCIDTVKNNTPDEEALQYIYDNCVSWVECPAELRDVFAGHAVSDQVPAPTRRKRSSLSDHFRTDRLQPGLHARPGRSDGGIDCYADGIWAIS